MKERLGASLGFPQHSDTVGISLNFKGGEKLKARKYSLPQQHSPNTTTILIAYYVVYSWW
jgi:hypothetical protein